MKSKIAYYLYGFYKSIIWKIGNSYSEFVTPSPAISRNPTLKILFGSPPVFYVRALPIRFKTVIGWGRKTSGHNAIQLAARHPGSSLLLLEDGFLRSVTRESPALSVVVDDQGIYYDASAPSRLERLIAKPRTSQEVERSAAIIQLWQHYRVSKYNSEVEYNGNLPQHYVLVIDQVFGDESVKYGQANADSFRKMLRAALEENPHSHVIVKTHPDIFSRKKSGYFDIDLLKSNRRIHVIADGSHPTKLIEYAQGVYTVTSQVGFEALIWGKRVRCFGMPFYAGWGLTQDELPSPSRRGQASLAQLVYAALVDYPRYIDQERSQESTIEKTMEYIGLQRKMRFRFPSKLYLYGFSPRKGRILRNFLNGSHIHPIRKLKNLTDKATVVLWGSNTPIDLPQNIDILRVEDGFIRSRGLGAALTTPLSWIIDDLGVYYDATKPSRLEVILQTYIFDEELAFRAKKLREMIVVSGITKYNLPAKSWQRPKTSQKILLVPGQVEDDASLKYGATVIRTNADLLQTVRERHPESYIVYKPHPDVVANLRAKGKADQEPMNFCDEVVTECSITDLLQHVDEVHTMTSLSGFEALLRGIPVTCYGHPFYAGWGLTTDIAPHPRRTRQLSMDDLVAGALILYPTYVSTVTNDFTTPERCIAELMNMEDSRFYGIKEQVISFFLKIIRALMITRNA